jgi:hypothetical protein
MKSRRMIFERMLHESGRYEMYTIFFMENLKRRGRLGGLEIKGKFNWVFIKIDWQDVD